MSITPPDPALVSPVVPYPAPIIPFDDVVPFTSRSGVTFAELFYGLRDYFDKVVIPSLNTGNANVVESWNSQVTNLVNSVNQALDSQASEVNEDLVEQSLAVNNALAALQQSVDTAVNQIINDTIEVTDPVVSGLLSDDNSNSATESQRLARLVSAPLGKIIYAEREGVASDGVTDVSDDLYNVISAMDDNDVLQLEAGSYLVNWNNKSWTKNVTVQGVKGRTRIVGSGIVPGQPANDNIVFDVTDGGVRAKDIIFEDHGNVFGLNNLSNELAEIHVSGCQFIRCGAPVYMGSSTGYLASDGETKAFKYLTFHDNLVVDCELGLWIPVLAGWEGVNVHDNMFMNTGRAAVWIGGEGISSDSDAYDPRLDQRKQRNVLVHNNIIMGVRNSVFAFGASVANGILVFGELVDIHDNILMNIENTEYDDTEGIYTKAAYFSVRNNILYNAGGSEGAINLKGASFNGITQLDATMHGLSLPQPSISVDDTSSFPDSVMGAAKIGIQTLEGWAFVNYTSKTPTTFEGVTGGNGTMQVDGVVRGQGHFNGYFPPFGFPGLCSGNIIKFDRTDKPQTAIHIANRRVVVENNYIDGVTSYGIDILPSDDVERTVVRNNVFDNVKSDCAIKCDNSYTVISGNIIREITGEFQSGSSSYRGILVNANARDIKSIIVAGNVLTNKLDGNGDLTTASGKIRFVHINMPNAGSVTDVVIKDNYARNVLNGIVISTNGTCDKVKDIDNDFENETGNAPTTNYGTSTNRAIRSLPVYA